MHLTTVHTSNYYSGTPSTVSTTSSSPCLNMSMTSRIMRHCHTCVSMNSTNTTGFQSNMSLAHSFNLHSRSIDSKENQGNHAAATAGIVVGIIIACILVGAVIGHAVRSNRKAHASSGNTRHATRRYGNPARDLTPLQLEMGTMRSAKYTGEIGLAAPSRAYTVREKAPQFPGPRNGYAPKSRASQRSASKSLQVKSQKNKASMRRYQ